MRIKAWPDNTGYSMWLSANDTYNWAHRPGKSWPCSQLSGKRLVVEVDSNGLCDLAIDGRTDTDCDGSELDAIVDDHLPAYLRHLWPSWRQPTFEERRAAVTGGSNA